MVKTLNAMGASATPMSYSELYTSLEQGVLDGGENAAGNVLNDKFYEVSGYFSMTQHFRPPGIVAIGKNAWDRLSAEQQKVLTEEAAALQDYEIQLTQEVGQDAVEKLKAKGMKVNDAQCLGFPRPGWVRCTRISPTSTVTICWRRFKTPNSDTFEPGRAEQLFRPQTREPLFCQRALDYPTGKNLMLEKPPIAGAYQERGLACRHRLLTNALRPSSGRPGRMSLCTGILRGSIPVVSPGAPLGRRTASIQELIMLDPEGSGPGV